MQQQAESAARSLIEETAGGLLQNLPVLGDLAGDATEDESSSKDEFGLEDLLPGLLESLFDSLPVNEEDDDASSE